MPAFPSTNKERKTNIIIKGAFTTKSSNNHHFHNKTPKSKTKNATGSKKEKITNDLMEKLLTEITTKYKTNLYRD